MKKSPHRIADAVDALTAKNVSAIAALEREAKAGRSLGARLAARVTAVCGSFPFVLVHVVLFAGWMVFNSLPGLPHVDPFPFTFLTLMVSLEAIFLSTFILIAQNEETRLTERRNALDLQINLLAEQENTKMLRMLRRIAQQVGVEVEDDPAVAALEQATEPERLAAQIDRLSETR